MLPSQPISQHSWTVGFYMDRKRIGSVWFQSAQLTHTLALEKETYAIAQAEQVRLVSSPLCPPGSWTVALKRLVAVLAKEHGAPLDRSESAPPRF